MEEDRVQSTEKSTSMRKPITWTGHEHTHFERNSEWFWALGLIAVAGAVTALLFDNLLFAIIILIISFVLAIFAAKKPDELDFAVTQRGVRINEKLYPYKSLESFGIDEFSQHHHPKLVLKPKSTLSQDIIIPLDEVDADEVHDFLLDFLPEEDHEEPASHKIMEWFGF